MAKRSESSTIKQMLSSGRLTIADPDTGFHRALYSLCPNDKNECSVHRIDRAGNAIIQVVFRCPICANEFTASPGKMFLR
jgi:hypothetical protein